MTINTYTPLQEEFKCPVRLPQDPDPLFGLPQDPDPVAIGCGLPDPVAIGYGLPEPVAIGYGLPQDPDPLAIGYGLPQDPDPVAIGCGLSRHLPYPVPHEKSKKEKKFPKVKKDIPVPVNFGYSLGSVAELQGHTFNDKVISTCMCTL